jgi:AAA15 family ATPase/GTPase
MLSSLLVKNYRCLKFLKIDQFSHVNLITGENNTGKSTLLEAISLFASQGDVEWIFRLLAERGEYYQPESDSDRTSLNLKSLSSLFYDRQVQVDDEGSCITVSVCPKAATQNCTLSLRIVEMGNQHSLGLEIVNSTQKVVMPLFIDHPSRFYSNIKPAYPFHLVRTSSNTRINEQLWDKIILTEKEDFTIEALRIVDPNIERLAFIQIDASSFRKPVVKLKGKDTIVPLSGMGDGINRVLSIILALVSSANGILLIDEFENGLHHSVQHKLWEVIFSMASKLNVQVFATTHSNDCIDTFEQLLNDDVHITDGKLIRLDSKDGKIVQVEFDPEEMRIATEQRINLR